MVLGLQIWICNEDCSSRSEYGDKMVGRHNVVLQILKLWIRDSWRTSRYLIWYKSPQDDTYTFVHIVEL